VRRLGPEQVCHRPDVSPRTTHAAYRHRGHQG
jgi:hypothetical protein